MKTIALHLKSPFIASLALTLPFVLLEWINRRQFHEPFPISLFAGMGMMPFLFTLLLMPLIRDLRAGQSLLSHPGALLLRVATIGLLVWLWLGFIVDQMPCFMGVPVCD